MAPVDRVKSINVFIKKEERDLTSSQKVHPVKVVKGSDCLFKVILQTQWSCLVDAAVHPYLVWLHHG